MGLWMMENRLERKRSNHSRSVVMRSNTPFDSKTSSEKFSTLNRTLKTSPMLCLKFENQLTHDSGNNASA